MFNPVRVARYFARVLALLLPILGASSFLSLIAVLLHREADWLTSLASWQSWLAVLIGTLPSIVALLATYILAVRFVQHLYGIETTTEARGVVNRCLFGQFGFGPWLRVAGGLAENAKNHILTRVGGPGNLVVYNDSAVLLQQSGRFTRVVQKGFSRLEKFETIYHAVDLRPKRWVHPVIAMSKEGIPITCEADISYQLDSEGIACTEEVPFPISEQKVFQAATCTWIREANLPADSRVVDWSGRVIIGETEGNLRSILARYPLDQLIGLVNPGSTNPREEIRQELEERLKTAVPKLGVCVLGVELGNIEVQDEITKQWIEVWKADWERWAVEHEALGKAKQTELLENAKTRAQVMLLATITEAFQPLLDQQQAVTSKLVLARLFMALSRAPSDPLTRVNLPKEAISTLKQLKDLIV